MQLKSVVEKLSVTYDRLPIPVEWITGPEEVTSTECIEGPGNINDSPRNTSVRVSNSLRKIPCNRNEDFFMGDVTASKSTNSVIIYHQNIRSLMSKKEELI